MSQIPGATCHNCGYDWEYRGENETARCPNCLFKTPVESDDSASDPIRVAGDDGEILDESDTVVVTDDDGEVLREIDVPPGATVVHSTDGSITSIVRPDESGVTITCEHCGHEFDGANTRGTFDGSRARYVCPECGESTEGPPPEVR